MKEDMIGLLWDIPDSKATDSRGPAADDAKQ